MLRTSSDTLYDLKRHGTELYHLINSQSRLAYGNFKSQKNVQATVSDCQRKLEYADFEVVQLGSHRLLASKIAGETVTLELTFERSYFDGSVVNYSFRRQAS